MLPALALGGLSAAGSLISGLGAARASKRQTNIQIWEARRAEELNDARMKEVNATRERLGREMLTIPETRSQRLDNYSYVDVDGMMAAAERSGFNPVTWLQAGGMQAYTRTGSYSYEERTGHNVADAFKLMAPDMVTTSPAEIPNQVSPLSGWGGALSSFSNAFGTQYRADQSYDLQLRKLDAAQGLFGNGLSTGNGLMAALSMGGAGSGGGQRSAAGGAGGLSDLPYPSKWKPGDMEVTNPFYRAFIDSKSPNAEAGEARYGEVGELLFGLRNITNDTIRNVTGRSPEDWGTAAGMNIGSYKLPTDTSWAPAFGRWWNSPTSLPNRKLPGFDGTVKPYMPFPGASAY